MAHAHACPLACGIEVPHTGSWHADVSSVNCFKRLMQGKGCTDVNAPSLQLVVSEALQHKPPTAVEDSAAREAYRQASTAGAAAGLLFEGA